MMEHDTLAKRCERTGAVHHGVNMAERDRLVCRQTIVIEIPFRRIFKVIAGRDADWQILEVERERLSRETGAVAVQRHVLIGDAEVVDVIGLHLCASVGQSDLWRGTNAKTPYPCPNLAHIRHLMPEGKTPQLRPVFSRHGPACRGQWSCAGPSLQTGPKP